MWKFLAAAGLAVALMIPVVASAGAVLDEKRTGVGCPDGQQGTFAFTLNQATSTEAGTVTAVFSSGENITVGAFTVSKRNQEYFINAYGTLLSASASLDGKLILNRFWCFPA